MSIVFILSLGVVTAVLGAGLTLVFLWITRLKKYGQPVGHLPKVSILVAARNEEKNIRECLKSLAALHYPQDKYEVLVGDDHSTDRTFEIASALCEDHPQIKVVKIGENLGYARGKANALAHLAREATGEFYFITDADCRVRRDWIQSLLSAQDIPVGIVIGTTAVDSPWQNMEWLLALGMIKVFSDLGRPVTAMGNNMYITKEAYDSVGGYEAVPFSVTEDYELYKQVKKKGYLTRQVVNEGSLAITKPAPTLAKLMQQRRRWMQGGVQLPPLTLLFLLLQVLYYPALIFIGIHSWPLGLSIFLLKSSAQALLIGLVAYQVKRPVPWVQLVFFEFYSAAIAWLTSLYYILPFKVEWKGRKY